MTIDIAVAQGDKSAPSCSEPGGVLAGVGLGIRVSGAAGAWKCTVAGTLPSLAKGEKTVEFEAVVADTLERTASAAYTITYITNTPPAFFTKPTLLATLTDAKRDDVIHIPQIETTDAEQTEERQRELSVCGGALPGGVSLGKHGEFKGTAARVATNAVFKFNICVTDGKATTKSGVFSIAVLAPTCAADDGTAVPVGGTADSRCTPGCYLSNPITALDVGTMSDEMFEKYMPGGSYRSAHKMSSGTNHQIYKVYKGKRLAPGSGHCGGLGMDWAPDNVNGGHSETCNARTNHGTTGPHQPVTWAFVMCDGHVPHYDCAGVYFDRRNGVSMTGTKEDTWGNRGMMAAWTGTSLVDDAKFTALLRQDQSKCKGDGNCNYPDACSEVGAISGFSEGIASRLAFHPSDQRDGPCFKKEQVKADPTGQRYKGKWESKCTGDVIETREALAQGYIMRKGLRNFGVCTGKGGIGGKQVKGLAAAKAACNKYRNAAGAMTCTGVFQTEAKAGKEDNWENAVWCLKLYHQDLADYYGAFLFGGDQIGFFRQQHSMAEHLEACSKNKACGCVQLDTRTGHGKPGHGTAKLCKGTGSKFDGEDLFWSMVKTEDALSPCVGRTGAGA